MKVLLVNPPYQTVTSNFDVGRQVPLGLLMVGLCSTMDMMSSYRMLSVGA